MTDLPPHSENPYQAPLAYASREVSHSEKSASVESANLKRMAIYQRAMLIAFATYFLQFLWPFLESLSGLSTPLWVAGPLSIVVLVAFVCGVVSLGLLAARLNGALAGVVLAVLAFFPCANIVILLAIHHQANKYFQRAGIRAGILGASWSNLPIVNTLDAR